MYFFKFRYVLLTLKYKTAMTTIIQYRTGGPGQCNKARKRNEDFTVSTAIEEMKLPKIGSDNLQIKTNIQQIN